MKRITLLVLVTLCGLAARSPAQVHLGLKLGKRVSVHADVGTPSVHYGSRYRERSRSVSYPSGTYRTVRYGRAQRGVSRGHYQWVRRKVWVPGHIERVYVPARYGHEYDDCGRKVRVLRREAHYEELRHEGYWKYERRRVLVGY